MVLTGSVEECDIAVDETATRALRAKLAAERGVALEAGSAGSAGSAGDNRPGAAK